MSYIRNYSNENYEGEQNMGWWWFGEIQELEEETDEETESEEE